MKSIRALFAGIVGALAMSATMLLFRLAGVNVSLESLLGTIFNIGLPAWITGFILHLAFGAVIALLYAEAFEIVQKSGPLMGGALGVANGLMAGLFMSSISAMNPVFENPNAPGAFLQHIRYGPVIFLFLHLIYGATVGIVYGRTVHKPHLLPKQV
jgi:hypothetical protein